MQARTSTEKHTHALIRTHTHTHTESNIHKHTQTHTNTHRHTHTHTKTAPCMRTSAAVIYASSAGSAVQFDNDDVIPFRDGGATVRVWRGLCQHCLGIILILYVIASEWDDIVADIRLWDTSRWIEAQSVKQKLEAIQYCNVMCCRNGEVVDMSWS